MLRIYALPTFVIREEEEIKSWMNEGCLYHEGVVFKWENLKDDENHLPKILLGLKFWDYLVWRDSLEGRDREKGREEKE